MTILVNMPVLVSACLLFLPPASLPKESQGGDAESRLRSQVDGQIKALRRSERKSALEAARFILAATQCHRKYDSQDGPLFRLSLDIIQKARRNNGLFGQGDIEQVALTTAWVYQALESYDRKRFADDLSKTKAAFAKAHNLSADKLTEALHPYKPESYGIYHQEADSATSSDAVDKLLRTVAAWERAHRKKGKKKRQREFLPFQQRGLDWLMKLQRDGQWRVPTGPGGKMVVDAGISALCLAALAAKPARLRSEEEAKALGKGIEWLLSIQKKDGSFSTYLPNYVTCTAVLALTKSQADGVDKALFQAQQFLRRIQNVERAGTLPQDRDYGSIGYGGDERGDLSNTQMAIEALRATGVQTSDPAIEKALLFLQRVQNLQGPQSWKGTRKTEDGRTVNVRAGNDGGAAYYPGNSPFGYNESTDGSLVARSYGSMTYALLKCYILAGLPKNDPRLQAALNWCLANFNLDENPGSKPSAKKNARYQGLYYYYLTLARALSLAEVDAIKDVDWRKALAKKLQEEQQKDGSWVNKKNGRWWEDNPMICTAYALLALSE